MKPDFRAEHQRRQEAPDTTPVHVPGKTDKAPLTLREELRRYVNQQISAYAAQAGAGSFEEEDDFSEDDDTGDLLSPYSVVEMRPEGENPRDDLEGSPDTTGLSQEAQPLPGDQGVGGEAAQARSAETPAPSPGPKPPHEPQQ